MRFAIALTALMLVFAGGASATSSEQPSWVDNEATTLASSCGGLRAEIIARMDYARELHVDYIATLQMNPAIGTVVGDTQWHSYWVDTYKQTIKLLKQGCYPPK